MDPLWELSAVADFTKDGQSDFLWRHSLTGDIVVWQLNQQGELVSGSLIGQLTQDWQFTGVGDFNSDHQADLLWSHRTAGHLVVWYMDGTTLASGELFASRPTEWKVKAVADFDSNGKDDLVWSNQVTGEVEIWSMDGVTQIGPAVKVETVPTAWQIKGSGDFNNDGHNDLLWAHKSAGDVVLWFMDDTKLTGGKLLTTISPLWQPTSQARGGLADLVIQDTVDLPESVTDGATINLSISVANQGSKTSQLSTLKYYLSNDDSFNAATDTFLGEIQVDPLRAGQVSNLDHSFKYNATTLGDSGSKYLFLVADANNNVLESDETNNVLSGSFTVEAKKPDDIDLILQNPEIPELWVVGENITLSINVSNQGTANAGASTLTIYVSDSPTFERSSATAIISRRLSALTGLTGTTESFTFPYLEAYGDGEKYLFFVADAESDVAEINETNNITALPIAVAPAINVDFAFIDSMIPETVVIGQPITASATVLNQGTTTSGATTLSLYLSNYVADTDVFDIKTATFVTTVPINALGASVSGVANLNFTYTSTLGSGQKNLFFVVDAANGIEEFREDNNVVKSTIVASEPLDIDLVIASPSISPTSVIAGARVDLFARVQNIGTVDAGTSFLRAYVSNDQILNEGDVQVWGRSIGEITGNSSTATQTAFFNYSPTYGTGTKYILFVADSNNTVFETNENNNITAVPLVVNVIQPGIDLVIANASVSTDTITVGQSMTINAMVQNQGETASAATKLGVYLSDTPTLDASTVLVKTVEVDSLGTYVTSSEAVTFSYLEAYGTGTKYVLVVADSEDKAAESNETNNIQVFEITALPDFDRPDLVISEISELFADLELGIQFRYDVRNLGNRATDRPFKLSAYLADRPMTNLEDAAANSLFLGQRSIPISDLEIGDSYSQITGFEVGFDFDETDPFWELWSPGFRYLVLMTDPGNEIAEIDETNNIVNLPVEITTERLS
ncbi:MAG: hypothetical protein HC929_08480 [Leptolyngbyaceae cyanobacterium SM2_5_2]|nr:hypothetical protein [Leptolyngbyaceae cyanobacterium SM2_5_2]